MDADGGRPVAARVAAAVTAPGLPALWSALYVGTALMLVAGVVCVGLAVPRAPAGPGPGVTVGPAPQR